MAWNPVESKTVWIPLHQGHIAAKPLKNSIVKRL